MSGRCCLLAVILLACVALPAAAGEVPQDTRGLVMAQAPQEDTAAAAPRRSRRGTTSGEKREPTARQLATRERQKKCGAEWRETKAAGKLPEGMRWPQFWSKCNSRLKGENV